MSEERRAHPASLAIEAEARAVLPSVDAVAEALRDVAFDLDLPPNDITAHPGWYDEPGPEEHLVFDSDQWSRDVATAILARLAGEERSDD